MQTVMNITIFSLHRQTMIALVASLEIIRRGIWNFFRYLSYGEFIYWFAVSRVKYELCDVIGPLFLDVQAGE